MDLGLSREEVGRTLGVKAHTMALWELGLHHVSIKYLPAVIQFLGFDPTPEVTSLSERLRIVRRRLGVSQRELAKRFGMDPKTIREWELGRVSRRTRRVEGLIAEFVREAEAASPEGQSE